MSVNQNCQVNIRQALGPEPVDCGTELSESILFDCGASIDCLTNSAQRGLLSRGETVEIAVSRVEPADLIANALLVVA